ncbi:hypothetical protein LUD75_07295 [Epilithonimonas sp. JDS]|uniref:hypothetical protein n=1 Tax=Epilithonimonas sp. JDS TaxID=2902797 RepID=UPI001E4E4A7E|nr:hypothetical protein [Epilithonimonas sp. JDS]MCD9854505.1 hypothetical protein [Epilithonimonas sp. JDS]
MLINRQEVGRWMLEFVELKSSILVSGIEFGENSSTGSELPASITGKMLAFSFRNKSVSKDTKQSRVTSLPDLSIGKANSS